MVTIFPTIALFSMPICASANIIDTYENIKQDYKEAKSFFEKTNETIDTVVNFFKNINENLINLSLDFSVWTYETITKFVLFTPAFLFKTEWFKNATLTFTGLAIGTSIVYFMYLGLKRILSGFIKNKDKKETELSHVSKRIPLVILGSGIAPLAFFYGFDLLNKLTQLLIDVGKLNMEQGMRVQEFERATWWQSLIFIAFDISLLALLIPVLLQNFRRWFDILCLAALTPLSLTAYCFKSTEHLFHQWWDSLKRLSITQLIYAVLLLIIGIIMFGMSVPSDTWEVALKLGIILGGIYRLNNPPSILSRYLDRGDNVFDMIGDVKDSVTKNRYIKKASKFIKRKIIPIRMNNK